MTELKECARLVESVAEQLDARCQTWKETLDRAYKDGKYNQNTGMWETDECKVSRARYTLDAYRDALSMVDTLGQQIDELNRRPSPSTAPLTLEELRKMDGEPVYIVAWPDWGHWELSADAEDYLADRDPDFYGMKHADPAGRYGLHVMGWLAYRRKPEEDAG